VAAEPPLFALDPTGRFTERAAAYALHRPSYPDGAIDAALESLGDPRALVAADVGAGTGISARLLAGRGVSVVAVEPNRAMREAAAPHPRVRFADGTAEATGLAPGSVGLVLCAQAFHWFRPVEALAEFRRILAPRGRLAVLANDRDESDAFTAAYSRLVREAAGEHPAEARPETFAPAVRAGGFEDVREREFRNEQRMDLEGLLGRAMSASYVPRAGPAHAALAAGLRALHARLADGEGRVRLAYRTHVLLARAPVGPPR
jgi:SAM-dependent methyltransferase